MRYTKVKTERITKLEREVKELKKSIKPILKEREEAIEAEIEDEKENEKVIKMHLCKKCGGVIVKGMMTSCMAASHGKRCKCKKGNRKP